MNLINIPELAGKKHPNLSEWTIRRLVNASGANGLQACKAVVMEGRKAYINETLFLGWVAARQAEKEARWKRPRVSKSKLNKLASGPWPCPTK